MLFNKAKFNSVKFILLVLAISLIVLLFFNVFVITNSKISIDKKSFDINEKISGTYNIFLQDGELIPSDTIIRVSFEDKINEMTLKEFIQENNIDIEEREGNFYLSGTNLSGEGKGYGFLGKKILYPDVYFQLRILENIINETINQTNQTNLNETASNITSNETIFNETFSNETQFNQTIEINETNEINETSEFPKYNQTEGEIISIEDNETGGNDEEIPEEPIIEITEPSIDEPTEQPEELPEEPTIEEPITEEPIEQTTEPEVTEPTEQPETTESEQNPETEVAEIASPFSERTTIETVKDTGDETKVELSTRYLRDYTKYKNILLYDDSFGRIVNGKCSAKETFMIYLLDGEEASLIPGSVHTDKIDLNEGVIQQGCSETCSIYTTDYSEVEEGFGKDYLLNQGSSFSLDLDLFNFSSETNGEKELTVELIYNEEILSIDKTKIIVGEINETNLTNETEINQTCLIDKDCDDENIATIDSCFNNTCSYEYKTCLLDNDCDDKNESTIDICENNFCKYELNLTNQAEINSYLIKDDPGYNLIIDSIDLNNETGELKIIFHHDYSKKLNVYFLNPENNSLDYEFNETKLKEGEIAELTVRDYNSENYFEIKLGDESEIIGFGKIPEYNFNLEIKNSKNETINATIEFLDLEENKKEFDSNEGIGKIKRGEHKIVVKPGDSEIDSIVFDNINLDKNIDKFIKIDYPNLEDYSDFVQIYAIDPSEFNFTEAIVTGMAVGDVLLKCKDWNFTEQKCFGDWVKIQDITPGEEYSIILTPDDPAIAQMQITNCVAEDNSPNSNSWGSACDNSYPGTALFSDDSTYETHTTTKSGSNNYWAGLRINSTNTSIIDCVLITNVMFCHKWWTSNTRISNCDISVDANGDASYTAINSTCPTASEPASIFCANVTSLESWACSNFFGTSATGAMAKSETQYSSSGPPSTYTITWDVFYFNVTYNSNTAPKWSNAFSNVSNMLNTDTAKLNVYWTEDVNLSSSILSTNETGNWANKTPVSMIGTTNWSNYTWQNNSFVGIIGWRIYANDSFNIWNVSDIKAINVTAPIINTAPKISLNLPSNVSTINNTRNINFNFTTTDDSSSIFNCSIKLDGILNQSNSSTINSTLTNFLINEISYGYHNWTINCSDGSLTNVSETRFFWINDTIVPIVNLIYPENLSKFYESNLSFIYNVTDINNIINCSLILNGAINQTNITITKNINQSFYVDGLISGNYTPYVNCSDEFNQIGQSNQNLFEIDLNFTLLEDIFLENATSDPINSTLEIYDENFILEYQETNTLHNTRIKRGKHTAIIEPINKKIKKIILNEFDTTNITTINAFVKIDSDPDNITNYNTLLLLKNEDEQLSNFYAFDPSEINFTNGTLTLTATGNTLWKCKNWSFENRACLGNWVPIQSLVVGEDYNVTITPDDPGFAESNVTQTTVTNYSVISTGKYNVSINTDENSGRYGMPEKCISKSYSNSSEFNTNADCVAIGSYDTNNGYYLGYDRSAPNTTNDETGPYRVKITSNIRSDKKQTWYGYENYLVSRTTFINYAGTANDGFITYFYTNDTNTASGVDSFNLKYAYGILSSSASDTSTSASTTSYNTYDTNTSAYQWAAWYSNLSTGLFYGEIVMKRMQTMSGSPTYTHVTYDTESTGSDMVAYTNEYRATANSYNNFDIVSGILYFGSGTTYTPVENLYKLFINPAKINCVSNCSGAGFTELEFIYTINSSNQSKTIFNITGNSSWVNTNETIYFSINNISNQTYVFVNSSAYGGDSTTWSVFMNKSQPQRNSGNNTIFAAVLGKTELAYFKLETDTEAPRWSNNATTPTSPATYNATRNYQFNVTWTDNTYISNVTIEHNFTGTLTNYSTNNLGSGVYSYNITGLNSSGYVWRMYAKDLENNTNVTTQWDYVVNKANTTTLFSVNQSVYPQGLELGQGYDVYVPFQVRLLDADGNTLNNSVCYVTNNETTDNVTLIFNASSGNYTGNMTTEWLYNLTEFNASCYNSNYNESVNTTSASVWAYLYLWDWYNLTYSNGSIYSSDWLRKNPTTGNTKNITNESALSLGENLINVFYLYGPGTNGSMSRDFEIYDEHTVRMNVSVNDTSCKPFICTHITDFDLNMLIHQCGEPQTISANTPTLIEHNLTGNYTVRQNEFLGLELYLNCSSAVTEKTIIYYNYTGMLANLEAHNAVPSKTASSVVKRIQLENNYLVGPNSTSNVSRKTWIQFNNTGTVPQYQSYYHLCQIDTDYPNSIVANTSYVYNSTEELWASDNVSAGAPRTAILYSSTNRLYWQTEIIENGTLVNETFQRKEKDAIRDNETLILDTANKKYWNISLLTIYTPEVSLENVTVWTNYSAYGLGDDWTFTANVTNSSGTFDITGEIVIFSNNKTIVFPKTHLSEINYQVTGDKNNVPTHTNPILNSTYGTNTTEENITCYNQSTSDLDGDAVKNVYLWYHEGQKCALAVLPFEGGSNSTWTKDYGITGDGEVYGATWIYNGGYDGFGAYHFDGDGDYIDTPLGIDPNTTAWTASAYFKLDQLASDKGSIQYILQQLDGTGTGRSWIYVAVDNGLYSYLGGATRDSGVDITDLNWHQAAIRWNGTTLTWIVDGVERNSESFTMETNDGDMRIGAHKTSAVYFNGTIDEVRIWPLSVVNEQIIAMYDNPANTLVSQQMAIFAGNTFSCEITPHDRYSNGTTLASNNLTIKYYCGTSYSGVGDWNITTPTICEDETIPLNGNLIINPGANLTFNNITLVLNVSTPGEYAIEANDNFTINNSNITSTSTTIYFFRVNGGTFNLLNSNLSRIGNQTISNQTDSKIEGVINCSDTGLAISSDNSLVENSIIEHGENAICYYNSSGQIIRNSIFRNIWHDGIYFWNSSNNLVEYNQFQDILWHLEIDENSTNVTVQHNTFDGVNDDQDAIDVWGNENIIFNNTIYHFSVVGIFISGVYVGNISGNNISFNNISDNAAVMGESDGAIEMTNAANNTVEYNVMYNNQGCGVLLYQGASENIIRHNEIINTSLWSAISIEDYCNNNLFENITIINGTEGINVNGSTGNVFRNLIIQDSQNEGIYVYPNSLDNILIDSEIINSGSFDIGLYDNSTFTFLNVSFDGENLDVGDVEDNSTLYVQWYLDTYVNDTGGNPVDGADVTAYDFNGDLTFNETTKMLSNIYSKYYTYESDPYTKPQAYGDWNIINNQLNIVDSSGSAFALGYLDDAKYNNQSYKKIETNFSISSTELHDWGAVTLATDIINIDGDAAYYSCWQQVVSGIWYLAIYKCNNYICTDYTLLTIDEGNSFSTDTEYQMIFERNGSDFNCTIPGVSSIAGSDSSWSGGYEGIGMYYANVTFDNTNFSWSEEGYIERQNVTEFTLDYDNGRIDFSNYDLNATKETFNSQTESINLTGNYLVGDLGAVNLTLEFSGCIGLTYNFTCGDTINESCTMNSNLTCLDEGFILGANDISVDGNSYTLTGAVSSNPGYGRIGINSTGYNNTIIQNFFIEKFDTGIFINDSDNVTAFNNNLDHVEDPSQIGIYRIYGESSTNLNISNNILYGINNAEDCLSIRGVNDSIISNNIITSNQAISESSVGIYLIDINYNNIVTNNTITGFDNGVSVANSGNNTFSGIQIFNGNWGFTVSGASPDNSADNLTILNHSTTSFWVIANDFNLSNSLIDSSEQPSSIDAHINDQNIIFLNVSFNKSKAQIDSGNLIVKWYLDAYVNYTNGTAAEGADVTLYSSAESITYDEPLESNYYTYESNPYTEAASYGTWTIIDNKLNIVDSVGTSTALGYINNDSHYDSPYKKVETDFTINSGGLNDYSSVVEVIDYLPDTSAYYSCWEQVVSGTWYLGIYKCNQLACVTYSTIASDSGNAFSTDTGYQMIFERNGSEFNCTVPGVSSIAGSDSSWSGGYEGIADYYANITYDNTNISWYTKTINLQHPLQYNVTTNSSGYIERQNVTEYFENVTGKTYYTNYSVNATKETLASQTEFINLTGNYIVGENGPVNLTLDNTIGCEGENYLFVCGDTINESCTMNGNLSSSGTCFTMGMGDLIVDCGDYVLEGNGSGEGFNILDYNNISIKNCKINSFYSGILSNSSNNSAIYNNSFDLNGKAGIFMINSNNNNITMNINTNTSASCAYYGTQHCIYDNSSDESAIVLCDQSNNSVIFENEIYGNFTNNNECGVDAGIAIRNSHKNNISNNFIYYTDTYGILIQDGSSENNISYNFENGSNSAGKNTNDGIIIGSSSPNYIYSNYFEGNLEWNIFLAVSNNQTIFNNTAKNSFVGIRLGGQSDNNNISNNILISNGEGIRCEGKDNLFFGNNISFNTIGLNLMTYHEVQDSNNSDNLILENTLDSNADIGINLQEYVYNNTLKNNKISNSNYGVYLYDDFDVVGISGNKFIDSEISGTTTYDLYSEAGEENNNTFLNVSFDNSKIQLNTGILYVQWYLDSYVNYTNGTAVDGADVTAYDVNYDLTFNTTTNSSGYIERQNVTEYYQTSSGATYYTNYSVNASINGFISETDLVNLTDNYVEEDLGAVNLTLVERSLGDCANITESGEYNLTEDINASGICFIINASDVTFNCNGYTIFGTVNNSVGVDILAVENTLIKNCTFINNQSDPRTEIFEGIRGIVGDTNTTIYNNTFLNNTRAIRLESLYDSANISKNELHNGEVAIIVWGVPGTSFTNVTIAENNATNFNTSYYWNAMVNVRNLDDNLYMYNNYFENGDWPANIELYQINNSEIYNNTFIGGTQHQNFELIDGSNYNHLFNNTIISGTDGVFISGSSNNLVEENNITEQIHHPIILYVHPTTPGNVTNNTILNNNLTWGLINGICSGGEETSPANNSVYNNRIEGNYIAHNGYAGINLNYGGGNLFVNQNTIINNFVEYNLQGGISAINGDNSIENNIVQHNIGEGLSVSGINNTVKNNTAFNNTGRGISFCASGIIENNNATSNGGNGFETSCVSDATILNNTAINNTRGFDISDSSNFTMNENTILNNRGEGIILTSCENTTIYDNLVQENNPEDLMIVIESESQCNHNISNNLGSGNRQILYYNDTLTLENENNISELIMCNADNSILNNISVSGSDILNNNGIFTYYLDNINISNIASNDNYYGLYFANLNNLLLENGTFSNNALHGIWVQTISNNTFIENITSNNNTYGIEIDGTYTRLYNSTFSLNSYMGVYLGGACANSLIYGSNISQSETGIFLTDSNITIENNILYLNYHGINIGGTVSDISILRNKINSSTSNGIFLTQETGTANISENILLNNTIGINLFGNKDLNIINDNIISGSSDKGIYLENDADNNTFIRNIINESNYAVYFVGTATHSVFPPMDIYDYPDDNLFLDSIIDGNIYCTANEENYNNNTFLNVTHDKTNVTVENGTLYFKWYVDTFVNYTNGTAVDGADVTAYDVNYDLTFNVTTNASGYIERQNVTEYYQTSSGTTYYTNYSINASINGFISETDLVNLTDNYVEGDLGAVNLTLNSLTGCIGETTNFTCGDTITESCTFNTNLTCSNEKAFTIGVENIFIDGAGYWLIGDSASFGFVAGTLNNITIMNLTVSGFSDTGLYMGYNEFTYSKANNCTLSDLTLIGNNIGLVVRGDYNLVNNSIFENNYVGCDIYYENNTIQQSIFDGNNYSFGFSTAFTMGGPIITQNNIILDSISINVLENDVYSETQSEDEKNILLNVSFNESSIYFGKGILDIQWYLDTYVNYTNGTAVDGANVSIYDLNNILRHSALTNSSGYILRQNVSEYLQNSTDKYYYTNYSVNATLDGFISETDLVNLTNNYIEGDLGTVNLTIEDCSIDFTMSENLTDGVHFGFIDGLPVTNYNASGNNGTGITKYDLSLEINGSCKANIYAKGWGALTSGLNTIELGNESFCYNNTNSSVPGIDCINLSTDYQLIGYNLSSGNYSYLKFYLDIPSGQAAGNYDNLIGIKANITVD